jgi:hypothetical protein
MKPTLRWLWPLLLIGSIVYAAGPNGAWMARQFTAPVPPFWGWFGAVLLGVAVFGGIKLAVSGSKTGIAIAAVGGIVAVVVDAQYFATAGHAGLMPLLLGAFPTLLAVLAGIVEGLEARAQESTAAAQAQARESRSAEEARQRLEWELREAAKDREAERRLRRSIAPATHANAPATQPVADGSPAMQPSSTPTVARTYHCDRCNRNSMDRFEYAAHRRYCRETGAVASPEDGGTHDSRA